MQNFLPGPVQRNISGPAAWVVLDKVSTAMVVVDTSDDTNNNMV